MKSKITWLIATLLSIASTATFLLSSGCSTAGPQVPAGTAAAEQPLATAGSTAKASGAQLWAQNCGHCHNIRTPTFYSDAQWEVVVLHMRVRANLTAEEHSQILAFLKSAH